MAAPSTPHYLGTADVADLLGISPMHVGRLARVGRIPVAGTKGRRNDRLFAADAIARHRVVRRCGVFSTPPAVVSA
jgi:hypothetical protein